MGSVRTGERVEFRLLGPFEADRGGRSLEVGSGKQRVLLAILLLQLNQVVPRDKLVEVLWGEDPPPSATTTLHSLISRLRRALADSGDGAGSPVVRARGPGYVLEADPDCVDAHRFERLAARAREQIDRGEPEAAVQSLQQALDLWRGDALVDLTDASFARLTANRLEEAHLTAVEDLADAELARGRPSEAAAVLESHVATHPFRERAAGQLMLSLYRQGRQADALAAYRRVRKVLVEELGVEPTPALRRLEDQILHQRPELDGPEPSSHTLASTSSQPRAPGDTVAFLFTDIEASTRRWEGNQEAMARDVARHDELLRSEVESAHGEVFTHTGDGLAAAFPTASAALTAAVTAQRALLGEQWAAAGSLRVRMAVHAGAAESRGGSYFGPTLNRVARLMAIASGGQVLCSQAASDRPARTRLGREG
jgi:DNA-binding SARP family transcriptional activator